MINIRLSALKKIIFVFWVAYSAQSNALISPLNESRMSFHEIEQARNLAKSILVSAHYSAPFINEKLTLNKLFRKVSQVRFNTPDIGYDFVSCTPVTLAYVEMYIDDSVMHLCHLSLIGSVEKLAQTIIHESTHLIGIEDECEVSKIELMVYRMARRELNYRNNYLQNCGL